MRTIHAQAPGAVKHFLGAKLNQEAVAAARGSDSPELRAAAKLVTAAFDAKRRRQTADGKDRTVQVTVAPERVAAHRQAILDSLREVYDHRESPTPARVLAGVTDGFE